MLVYHGGIRPIQAPDVSVGRKNLDFGKGFYVTTLREQAEKWAIRKAMRKDKPVVSVYEFDETGLFIKRFSGYTADWLNYVAANRSGMTTSQKYDAVFGHVANDDVANAVAEYMQYVNAGRADETTMAFSIKQLSFQPHNDQLCFKTEKAVANLRYLESYEVG